ncbi:MAG: hypothetical protein U1D35_00430 [Paracoccaceae bacterium]|nr:hypothetical protein [Paracoccaceae bacterium]
MPNPELHHDRSRAQVLEQALDRVHRAALAGELDNFGKMAAEIEALLAQISGLDDLALARRLHEKAERNAVCLQAASRGVRAARRRVAEIAAARTGLVTYDGKGRRAHMTPTEGQLTQRL